jgi:hypothetical protein
VRRSLPLALAALAVLGTLTACAPAAQGAASPTPDAPPAATPTPTPTAAMVTAGQLPPAVFGGDCEVAVPAGVLAAATGIQGIEVTRRDADWTRAISNIGGLVCEWRGGNVSGDVAILPKVGLDGAALPAAQAEYYFDACDWGCSWEAESADLWISGYASDLPDLGRAEADRIGAEIAAGIAADAAAAGIDWQLDRMQWWPAQECDALAAELTTQLGQPVTAQAAGYHDPPSAATALADIASRRTWCAFESDGRQIAIAVFESGAAWDVPWADLGEAVDLGVPGVEAFLSTQGGYLGGQVYEATDGINAMTVETAPDSGWDTEDLASVFVAAFVAP